MPSLLRGFVQSNRALSRRLDRLLPLSFSQDGYQTFLRALLPDLLHPNTTIYDLGGGSLPCLSLTQKQQFNLTIIGMDIDADELARAPAGIYDEEICADISRFRGRQDADLVVCLAALEHVRDVPGALAALATIVKPGGRTALFVPCRNALFARLNLILPQRLKERLLFTIFPETADGHQGFQAFYDSCTPREMTALARASGFAVEQQRCFWFSNYFSFLFPLYLLWRLWTILARACIGAQAAETFFLVLRRQPMP